MTRTPEQRDVATIRRLSQELVQQCGIYVEHKQKGYDRDAALRALLLDQYARRISQVATRARRRYFRENPL